MYFGRRFCVWRHHRYSAAVWDLPNFYKYLAGVGAACGNGLNIFGNRDVVSQCRCTRILKLAPLEYSFGFENESRHNHAESYSLPLKGGDYN